MRHHNLPFLRGKQLDELLDLSEQILSFAQLGDWGSAVKLQQYRREGMERFFAEPCLAGETTAVADAIREILDIDSRVSDILYGSRSKLMEESNRTSRGMRQLDSYLTHSV